MGDLETAKSYLHCVVQNGQDNIDDAILQLQIAAKSGNREETRQKLAAFTTKNVGQPHIMAEVFAKACEAAQENGWRCVAASKWACSGQRLNIVFDAVQRSGAGLA